MAAAAIVAAAGGRVMQAVGAIKQGQAAQAAGEYNATVAEQNASMSLAQSAEEVRRYRIQSRKQLGDMRANYGASGVTLEGSPLDYLEESASTAELDALTIKHQGDVKAAGYMNSASLSRYEGDQALKGSYFSAAGSLLQGAGEVASMTGGGASEGAAPTRAG